MKIKEFRLPFSPERLVFPSYSKKKHRLKYTTKTSTVALHECKNGLRAYYNKVMRNTLGPKEQDVTADWIKLHEEELHASHSSENTIQVIKSKRMR